MKQSALVKGTVSPMIHAYALADMQAISVKKLCASEKIHLSSLCAAEEETAVFQMIVGVKKDILVTNVNI